MNKIYDISQTLRPGIPVWPGDTEYQHEVTWELSEQCPVNVSRMTMSTHTGTHADSPLHYLTDGCDSANSDLTPYIGEAIFINLSQVVGERLELTDIEALLPDKVSRIIVKLMPDFPHNDWPVTFPYIAPEVIKHLATKGCLLIGTDTPSLDDETSKELQAHHAVAAANMSILEGLVLDNIPNGSYELIALPLKIEGADASPVRAILRELS